MRFLFTIGLLLCLCAASFSQTVPFIGTEPVNSIRVLNGPDTLYNAWAGGLTFPRFGQLDVNLDGLPDLLVFDRDESRLQVYRNTGLAGNTRWQLEPGWA